MASCHQMAKLLVRNVLLVVAVGHTAATPDEHAATLDADNASHDVELRRLTSTPRRSTLTTRRTTSAQHRATSAHAHDRRAPAACGALAAPRRGDLRVLRCCSAPHARAVQPLAASLLHVRRGLRRVLQRFTAALCVAAETTAQATAAVSTIPGDRRRVHHHSTALLPLLCVSRRRWVGRKVGGPAQEALRAVGTGSTKALRAVSKGDRLNRGAARRNGAAITHSRAPSFAFHRSLGRDNGLAP